MKSKYLFAPLAILLLTGVLLPRLGGAERERLRIVTTLPTFAEFVRQVGGDLVDVSSIASPRFNPHFIEPKPSDVLRVKRADLFIASGLDLEPWMTPLLNAAAKVESRPGGTRFLALNEGISLLEVPTAPPSRSQGDIHPFGNPHTWLAPRNAMRMAEIIAKKLIEIDPANAASYESNLARFRAEIERASPRWLAEAAPYRGDKLVAYHNEWAYLAEFLGVRIEAFLEPKPGIPPTPRQVEYLTEYIPANGVKAILQPSYVPSDAAETLSVRTGVSVVILCQSVGELPECPTYGEMIDFNVRTLVATLARNRRS